MPAEGANSCNRPNCLAASPPNIEVTPVAFPAGRLKTKDWLDRAKSVVAAARERAVERAQQRAAPLMKRPLTLLQRRRLAERLPAASRP